MLPKINNAPIAYNSPEKKLFIVSEGFEKRSLYWISEEGNNTVFEETIICRYSPSKISRFDEMLAMAKTHTTNEPIILDYNRFEPAVFEHNLKKTLEKLTDIEEIIIDISVMSKLLIMIIINCLGKYRGKVNILYTEPCSWGPKQEVYNDMVKNKTYGTCIGLSSIGVGNVVRTPKLSSIVMQSCPILAIVFLSFNEQLINVLINEISPGKIQVFNHRCSSALWREEAMYAIHRDLIEENLNPGCQEDIVSFELTDYKAVFEALAEIYRNNCYDYRIVISPTGCKLHAVACSLLKLCCPDIHIEYPTPESYLFEGYSSDEIRCVHEISFYDLERTVKELRAEYLLNG